MSFNPALYLYLNPELSALCNITSVDQAKLFYDQTSNNNDFLYDMEPIPPRFDEYVYISDNKYIIDISHLNQVIKAALCNQGLSTDEIDNNGKYVTSIFKESTLINTNIFQFNNMTFSNQFYITPSNLNIGDEIKIVKNNRDTFYAKVVNIIDNQTIEVQNDNYDFIDTNSAYIIYGIKVCDPYRLATINYLYGYRANCNLPPVTELYYDDAVFNPVLYKMLYSDVRLLDDASAYIDFVNRKDNGDFRIGRTQDIKTTLQAFTDTFYNLNVLQSLNMQFDPYLGYFKMQDVVIRYISEDDVTVGSNVYHNHSWNSLITEYAIKTYVDRPYLTTATFCNIIVNGNADFLGQTTMKDLSVSNLAVSNLYSIITVLDKNTTSCNNFVALGCNNYMENATICNLTVIGDTAQVLPDALFDQNINVMGAMMGPRIGIGPYMAPIDENTLRYDRDYLLVNRLVASSNVQIGTPGVTTGTICLKVNGMIEADNVVAFSDKRLKINVKPWCKYNRLVDQIDTVSLYSFDWKFQKNQAKMVGFIAQELEETFPEAIITIPLHSVNINLIPTSVQTLGVDGAMLLIFNEPHGLQDASVIHLKTCTCENEKKLKRDVDFAIKDDISIIIYYNLHHTNACKITKAEFENVKSIDYSFLTCAMFGMIKELKHELKKLTSKSSPSSINDGIIGSW